MTREPRAARRRGDLLLTGVVYAAAVAAQVWFLRAATSRIWYEELAESVRNVYWLQDHRIYDGASSNIGWYGLLLVVYKVFGFSLAGAKLVRLALHLVSLACLLSLLDRWLGRRGAIVPMLAISLSPTLLYFNTMHTSYGIDLQWAPILLWIVFAMPLDGGRRDLAIHAALGALLMIASLMWPVALLYCPILALSYLLRRAQEPQRRFGLAVTVAALAAVVPFVAALFFLTNPGTFLHDPQTGTGVFRGGGGQVAPSRQLLLNLAVAARDVVASARSYHVTIPAADLSGVLGLTAAGTVLVLTFMTLRSPGGARRAALLALALFVVNLLAGTLAAGPPGLRRFTGCLAAFYVLFVIAWRDALLARIERPQATWPKAALLLLAMLPVHHLAVLPSNLRSFGSSDRPQNGGWFGVRETPAASLEYWTDDVARGRVLDCRDIGLDARNCRYDEVYAAVAGNAEWNRHQRLPVSAYDFSTGRPVPLSRQR